MARIFYGMRFGASLSVEAAFVIPIIFFTLMLIIRQAYIVHDTVSGSMILEESVERVRYNKEKDLKPEDFAKEGEEKGDPRLWLGKYEVDITRDVLRTVGYASAGEWQQEINMNTFDPARFIRVTRAAEEAWSAINGNSDAEDSN